MLASHLLSIVRVIAPILPHLAEDVWQHLPFPFTTEDGHVVSFVFESKWPALDERHLAFPDDDVNFWGTILEVICDIPKLDVYNSWEIEKMRSCQNINHYLSVVVVFFKTF